MTDTPAILETDPAVTVTQPPSGWRSSEAWLSLLAVLLGALASSGLITGTPIAVKLVGMAIAALTALGYTTNRTSLKRAHLQAAQTASIVRRVTSVPPALAAVLVSLVVVLATIGIGGCGPTQKAIATGGNSFLQCGKQDLTQIVNDGSGLSLLHVVANDLSQGDYGDAIAALMGKLGPDLVGCAVIAVRDVFQGTGDKITGQASPIVVRAQELIDKNGWRIASSGGK